MNSVKKIFEPLDNGKNIIIHQGLDLRDFTPDDQNRILPLNEGIRIEATKRNMILLEYSISGGITFDTSGLTKEKREGIIMVLNQFKIINPNSSHDQNEFAAVMRGLLKLVEAKEYPTYRDGSKMVFMIIIEFAEHQCPSLQPGFLSNEQKISIELASKLSKSIGLRKSGCYVIFSEAREGSLDNILTNYIDVLRLPQPDAVEKRKFLSALKSRYPNVEMDSDLTDDAIINISSNTPNRGLEQIFLSSTLTKQKITSKQLSAKKQADIISLSEGTLEAVDFERVKGKKLEGINIERPLFILSKVTNDLKNGKRLALRNLILAGAPSTGKTDLVTFAALKSGIQAFNLNSPKSGIVGESERKAKLMLNLLKEQRGVGIIDELEMVLPMNRANGNNDSGVSQNLMGQLQSFLSDSSLAGKVTLFATSNKPGDISSAMLSRWIVVPVLQPLKCDYPAIVKSIILNIDSKVKLDDIENLKKISDKFFHSGASPRDIRESIAGAVAFLDGELSARHLDFAAKNLVVSSNRESYIHSDLTAIKFCRSYSYLPWWDIERNEPDPDYPYPEYIREIMDDDLRINQIKLYKILDELAPHSNV
jgi:hypothetical protein